MCNTVRSKKALTCSKMLGYPAWMSATMPEGSSVRGLLFVRMTMSACRPPGSRRCSRQPRHHQSHLEPGQLH